MPRKRRKRKDIDFSRFSLGELAIMLKLMRTSTLWENGEGFQRGLSVFAENPKEVAGRLIGTMERELIRQGIYTEDLR